MNNVNGTPEERTSTLRPGLHLFHEAHRQKLVDDLIDRDIAFIYAHNADSIDFLRTLLLGACRDPYIWWTDTAILNAHNEHIWSSAP